MRNALRLLALIVSGLMIALLPACQTDDVEKLADLPLDDKEAQNLDWKISFSLTNVSGNPRLAIKQSFVMPRESILLKLPDSFLRKTKLYQRIESLQLSGGQLSVHPDSDSYRIFEHPPGEQVTINYLIRPDDPITYGEGKESFSAPIIRSDYFQFVMSMVMIYPVLVASAPSFPLILENNLPNGFKFFNSYGAEQSRQEITTDFDKLRDTFVVSGRNIRVYKIHVRNRPVFITFDGRWEEITDKEFVDVASRLLSTQRETFKDDNFPYFLINFMANNVDCHTNIKFAGTAHPNSFRSIFPGGDGCKLDPEMKQLISHELMHMWIGKKIRVGSEHSRSLIDGKWFTEGFTDYFGRLLAYRSGVLDEKEYFKSLNRQIEKYFISSERFVTLKSLEERMYRRGYSTRTLEDIPYQQGEMMAWILNEKIKRATSFKNSLDDVILDMLEESKKEGGVKRFDVSEVQKHVDKYVTGPFFDEYKNIEHGRLFTPAKLDNCRDRVKHRITKFQTSKYTVAEDITTYAMPTSPPSCSQWLR